MWSLVWMFDTIQLVFDVVVKTLSSKLKNLSLSFEVDIVRKVLIVHSLLK